MNKQSDSERKRQKQGFVMRAILMSGAALMIVGLYGLFQPADLIDTTGMDKENAQILSLALITVGLGDVVAVIFLSRLKEKT